MTATECVQRRVQQQQHRVFSKVQTAKVCHRSKVNRYFTNDIFLACMSEILCELSLDILDIWTVSTRKCGRIQIWNGMEWRLFQWCKDQFLKNTLNFLKDRKMQ